MSQAIETKLLPATQDGIAQAAMLLQKGALVALPTETVYGLGGDARNNTAVARIFQAKARPSFNPLIIHVPDLDSARRFALIDAGAERLAATFWPGPLTLVVPLRQDAGLSDLVTAGNDSVAIRVPEHPLAQALLAEFGGPIAAPSANPSGKVSPTNPQHVLEGLSGRIEAILDGGPCAVGVESTIIGMTGAPTLLRPGGLPAEVIEACLGAPLERHRPGDEITAPGQLTSHYAPGAPVQLNVTRPLDGQLWIGFGPECPGAALNLSASGDLVEAAAHLFDYLRRADALAGKDQTIAIAPVPHHGLGLAINDRLMRAAAPRP